MVSSGCILLPLFQQAFGERFVPRSLGLDIDEAFNRNIHGANGLRVRDLLYKVDRVEQCIMWLFDAHEKVFTGRPASIAPVRQQSALNNASGTLASPYFGDPIFEWFDAAVLEAHSQNSNVSVEIIQHRPKASSI